MGNSTTKLTIKIGLPVLWLLLSGCTVLTNEKLPPIPEDFVIEVNTQEVQEKLNALDYKEAISVKFQKNKKELSNAHKAFIDKTIINSPALLVAVQGAAGRLKYKHLGNARQLQVVKYLQGKGVETVLIDYNTSSPGPRANMWILDDELSQLIRETAPSLIVYP